MLSSSVSITARTTILNSSKGTPAYLAHRMIFYASVERDKEVEPVESIDMSMTVSALKLGWYFVK
jgi:hypothetical protein